MTCQLKLLIWWRKQPSRMTTRPPSGKASGSSMYYLRKGMNIPCSPNPPPPPPPTYAHMHVHILTMATLLGTFLFSIMLNYLKVKLYPHQADGIKAILMFRHSHKVALVSTCIHIKSAHGFTSGNKYGAAVVPHPQT